jgi:hypothetical protein
VSQEAQFGPSVCVFRRVAGADFCGAEFNSSTAPLIA